MSEKEPEKGKELARNEIFDKIEREMIELEKELHHVATEMQQCLTNGWTDQEKKTWPEYLETEIKPYYPMLHKFLVEHILYKAIPESGQNSVNRS